MRRLVPLGAALALTMALSPAATADPRQGPSADFTAEMVTTVVMLPEKRRHEVVTTVWSSKGKTRTTLTHEGLSMSWIIDPAARIKITLMHAPKYYLEQPLTEEVNRFATGQWEIVKAGEDIVAGAPTVKWSFSGKERGGVDWKGFVWTTKENIPVKQFSETTSAIVTIELRNLKVGPVDAAMFETPLDFTPMPKP